MADIEIIPWVHHVGSELFWGAVKYIQKIPRNSILVLELPQEDVAIAVANISSFRDTGKSLEYLAIIPILQEAKKRNIRVVGGLAKARHSASVKAIQRIGGFGGPKDPNVNAKELDYKAESAGISIEEGLCAETFAIASRSPTTVYLMPGINHTLMIQKLLQEKGVSTTLRTDFMGRLEVHAKRYMAMMRRKRRAYLENDYREFGRVKYEIEAMIKEKFPLSRPLADKSIEELRRELVEHNEKLKTRIDRKRLLRSRKR